MQIDYAFCALTIYIINRILSILVPNFILESYNIPRP